MKRFLLVMLMVLMVVPAYAAEGPDVDLGGLVKLRGYSFENMWDLNDQTDGDNWNVFRLQTSLNGSVDLGDNVFAFVQVSNQNYSEGVTAVLADKWEEDNISNKVFVDNAFIDINSIYNLPLSFRMGRQNLMYGSGFVLFDGQSQYASTSLYFDGVKATWDITDKAKIDFLYFKDQEFSRGDSSDDDITLSGAYFTGKCPVIGGTQEIYILNRTDEDFDLGGIEGDKDIWMYGLRLSDKFASGLDYSAEIAYQGGDLNEAADVDQDALGYKLESGFTFDTAIKPRIFVGYAYMSGDDTYADGESNSWDVFYGGWPQFGDLLAWTFVNGPAAAANAVTGFSAVASVPGEAAYSNLILPKIGISTSAGNVLLTELSYTKILIDERVIAGGDKDFGNYYQLAAKVPYNKYLTFAMYAAAIDPGDAFRENINPALGLDDDMAYEFFWETQVKF